MLRTHSKNQDLRTSKKMLFALFILLTFGLPGLTAMIFIGLEEAKVNKLDKPSARGLIERTETNIEKRVQNKISLIEFIAEQNSIKEFLEGDIDAKFTLLNTLTEAVDRSDSFTSIEAVRPSGKVEFRVDRNGVLPAQIKLTNTQLRKCVKNHQLKRDVFYIDDIEDRFHSYYGINIIHHGNPSLTFIFKLKTSHFFDEIHADKRFNTYFTSKSGNLIAYQTDRDIRSAAELNFPDADLNEIELLDTLETGNGFFSRIKVDKIPSTYILIEQKKALSDSSKSAVFSAVLLSISTGLVFSLILFFELKRRESSIVIENNIQKAMSNAVKASHTGLWEYNPVTDNLEWDDSMYEIFEIDDQSKIQRLQDFLEFVKASSRRKLNKVYASSIKEKEDYNVVYTIKTNKGNIRHVEEKGSHKFDKNGTHVFSTGSISDITQQYALKRKLKSQESRYQALFNNTQYGLFTMDLSGEIIEINSFARRVLGYRDRSDLNIKDICKLKTDKFLSNIIEQARNNIQKDLDLTFFKKNGSVISASATFSMIESNGYETILVSFSDISSAKANRTILQQSYRDFEVVIDSVDYGIGMLNLTGEILKANPASRKYLMIDNENGVFIHDLLDKEARGILVPAMEKAVEGRKAEVIIWMNNDKNRNRYLVTLSFIQASQSYIFTIRPYVNR